MRRTSPVALVVCFSGMLIPNACGQRDPTVGGTAMYATKTIVENAINSPIHTTLVAAVKAAGLVDTLSSPGPFTVFAPTDDAFAKLPAGTVDTLVKPENKNTLAAVLTYHVVPGRISSKEIIKDIKKGGGAASLKTVEGEPLTFTLSGGKIRIADAKGGTATITTADVYQSNGVIDVIDSVLMPNNLSSVGGNGSPPNTDRSTHRSPPSPGPPVADQSLPPAPPLTPPPTTTPAIPPAPPRTQAPGAASNKPPAIDPSVPSQLPSPPGDISPAPQSAGSGTHEYDSLDELRKWKNGLMKGQFDYGGVPSPMTVGKASTVTVKIYGFDAKDIVPMGTAKTVDPIQVSAKMKVQLLSASPTEFTIPPNEHEIQLVPEDGFAVWNWDVTPNYEAKGQQLLLRVSLVHQTEEAPEEQIIDEKTYIVDVDVESLFTTFRNEFWKDPLHALKLVWGQLAALVTSLGGLGGLIAWWRKRAKRRRARS